MANPITWRNIGQLDTSDSNRLRTDSLNTLTSGINELQSSALGVRQELLDQKNKREQLALDNVLAQVNNLNSVGQVQSAMQNGLLNQGNLTDAQRIKVANALGTQLDEANRIEGVQRAIDQRARTENDRIVSNQVNIALANKDFATAAKLAQGHSQAGQLALDVAGRQKTAADTTQRNLYDTNVLGLIGEARTQGTADAYQSAINNVLADVQPNNPKSALDALQLITQMQSADPTIRAQQQLAQVEANRQQQSNKLDEEAVKTIYPFDPAQFVPNPPQAVGKFIRDEVLRLTDNGSNWNLNPLGGTSEEEGISAIQANINEVESTLRSNKLRDVYDGNLPGNLDELPAFTELPLSVVQAAFYGTPEISQNAGLGTWNDIPDVKSEVGKKFRKNMIAAYVNWLNNLSNYTVQQRVKRQNIESDAAYSAALKKLNN